MGAFHIRILQQSQVWDVIRRVASQALEDCQHTHDEWCPTLLQQTTHEDPFSMTLDCDGYKLITLWVRLVAKSVPR